MSFEKSKDSQEGAITFGENGYRLEATLRGDSARMMRGLMKTTRMSASDVVAYAWVFHTFVSTRQAAQKPLMVVEDGTISPFPVLESLPELSLDDELHQKPLHVNINDEAAHYIEMATSLEGTSVTELTNRAIHMYSQSVQMLVGGTEFLNDGRSQHH